MQDAVCPLSRSSEHRTGGAPCVALTLLVLASCGPDLTAAPEDGCGAADLQAHIGQMLDTVPLPADGKVRVIRPGMAVTMDYVPERLNVDVDASGIVTRIHCG